MIKEKDFQEMVYVGLWRRKKRKEKKRKEKGRSYEGEGGGGGGGGSFGVSRLLPLCIVLCIYL